MSGTLSGLTAWVLWDKSSLQGWQVGLITFGVFVVGLFIVYGIIFLWNLFRTPYRQRDEAWKQISQLTSLSADSKYYEENAERAFRKHCNDLALLCQDIASKMSLPFSIDERYARLADEVDKADDGIKAIMFINHWETLDYQKSPDYIRSEADWGLYSHLQTHLTKEDPNWEAKMTKLKDAAVILHKRLYALAQVAIGVTEKWHIIPELEWGDPALADIAVDARELSPNLLEAILPLNNEIRQAYKECYEASSPIHIKLVILSKRGIFHGKCPACPDYSEEQKKR